MSNSLYRELINLTEEFEKDYQGLQDNQLAAFAAWLSNKVSGKAPVIINQPDWEGKSKGRSPESIINTSIVHLYRYARIYSKLAISKSDFTTLDDVIFLLNLLHRGSMTKIQLIELNIHEKSTGIQIINRLLNKSFITEVINQTDRRSKKIDITEKGKDALEQVMDKIRNASRIVAGDLNENEKLQLISLLQRLELFHHARIKHSSEYFENEKAEI